jgi:hypothetical protein
MYMNRSEVDMYVNMNVNVNVNVNVCLSVRSWWGGGVSLFSLLLFFGFSALLAG